MSSLTDRLTAGLWRRSLTLPSEANGLSHSLADPSSFLNFLHATPDEIKQQSDLTRWRREVTAEADKICQNHLTIFNFEDHDLGPEIQWNYEYGAKMQTPMSSAASIDYRDYSVTGDAKLVWEPNRHQHLVVLGRAYHLTGDCRYAKKVVEHIESWINQCPYGRGMNWRSPLELAIRLINWAWALELIRSSGVLNPEFYSRFLPVVFGHLTDISRKYSRYSSANNHLVGEAAGVFIGSVYFRSLKKSQHWEDQSRKILIREIARQVNPDGGHAELATGYHLFVLEFFLLAGLLARRSGRDFPVEYWERLERMFDYVAAFSEGGESLPMFGDSDDGYVLNLGGRHDPAQSLLAVGAVLFERSDFKSISGGLSESVYWLHGESGCRDFEQLPSQKNQLLQSRAFPDTGYYLLQTGHRSQPDRISVTFDCGPLGFGSIAAHGHADALGFTLRAFGEDILIDPGTFDYFTDSRWRDYFRSTRAHNTIVVDHQDQSQVWGPFLWGARASSRCVQWQPTIGGGTVAGEHDGYSKSGDSVLHRRRISLDGSHRVIDIEDELKGEKQHHATLYLHFAERCSVRLTDSRRCEVTFGSGKAVIELDPNLEWSEHRGSEDPILGWVSRGYHRKNATTTLAGQGMWQGDIHLRTRIVFERQE